MAFSPVIFPSVNDVRGASAVGTGNKMSEAYLAAKWGMACGVSHSYRISGGALSGQTTPNATIAAGEYFIKGYYVSLGGSESIAVGANANGYLYLQLLRDGAGNVTGVAFASSATLAGATGADSMLLGFYTVVAGSITKIMDLQRVRATRLQAIAGSGSVQGIPAGAGSFVSMSMNQYIDNASTMARYVDGAPSGGTASFAIAILKSGNYGVMGSVWLPAAVRASTCITKNGGAPSTTVSGNVVAASPATLNYEGWAECSNMALSLNAGDYLRFYCGEASAAANVLSAHLKVWEI